jgi:uncharacterized protein YkwD
MRSLLTLILLWVTFTSQGQTDSSVITSSAKLDLNYLEWLTFRCINDERLAGNLNPVQPDSHLYQAAVIHAKYLVNLGKLSHFQKGNKSLKDPSIRAEYCGAHNFQIGENLLQMPFNSAINANKKLIEPKTYSDYAKLAAKFWMESAHHKANILTPEFTYSGLALVLNKANDTLYLVQIFGNPTEEYQYRFSRTSFPYYRPTAEKKK